MDIYEITGFKSGLNEEGVNYLLPSDSFSSLEDGFVHREVLKSRRGLGYFAPRLAGATRVTGIFEHILPDGTKELLVTDTNYLYKYNTTTKVFDQIPFAGSMAAYGGFNITAKDTYISGVSYPTKNNSARFVFTGSTVALSGTSAVFFYNGTDVRSFVSDNAEYGAPADGPLNRAKHVVYYNERLNFVCPTINSVEYNQSVLYSGIKDGSGNGDKFNVSGSGDIRFSTSEEIRGYSDSGEELRILLTNSTRALEITADAFNPYRIRNIPSVQGTDCDFSTISWNNTTASMGKRGILRTDGRESLKIDNKIPDFTRDNINQTLFNYTYGGYDRDNGQYLWSYVDSASGATTQDKVLIRNFEENSYAVFNQRLTVFNETEIGNNLIWNEIEAASGNSSWDAWDTTEEVWNKVGRGEDVFKLLAGDDLGFVYELNKDFDDYTASISNITQASNAVVTVAASAFQAGDLIAISSVEGMTEINNYVPSSNAEQVFRPYEVISATPTSVTLNVDSSLFTAYSGGGFISKPISFNAELNPFNPYRQQGRNVFVSEVEVLMDLTGGAIQVDVYQDEQTSPFISNTLLAPTSTVQKNRKWMTFSVNQEAEFLTFKFKQISPGFQVRITNVRIHCEPGGETNG